VHYCEAVNAGQIEINAFFAAIEWEQQLRREGFAALALMKGKGQRSTDTALICLLHKLRSRQADFRSAKNEPPSM